MNAHYEKIICLCGFLTLFCNVGLASTSFSVYQPYIVALPGVGDAGGSAVQATRILVSMAVMLFADRYYQRFDVRLGTLVATLALASAFVVYGLADSLGMLLLGAAIAGVAYGLGGMIAVTMLINRWFASGLGSAIGFASVGSGVAFMVVPLAVTRIAESVSLRAAFWFEAALAVLIAVAVFALMRNYPRDIGAEPYHGKSSKRASRGKPSSAAMMRDLPRSARCLLLLGMALSGAISMTAMTYYAVLLVSEGYDVHFAALLLSVSGIALTVAKYGAGEVFDRVGPRRATMLMFGVLAVGLVCCCFTANVSAALAAAAALLVGAGLSIGSVGTSVWSLELSDAQHRSRSIKNCQTAYALGGFLMNMVPGPLKELTGSYITSYVLLLALAAVAASIVLGLYSRYRS